MSQCTRSIAASILVAVVAAACVEAPSDPLARQPAPSAALTASDGRYIVVLRDELDAATVAAGFGIDPEFLYAHALSGFAAAIPADMLPVVAASSAVRWVEPVQQYALFQKPPPRDKPCRGRKCETPPSTGANCAPGTSNPNGNDPLTDLFGIRQTNAPSSTTWINSPVAVDIAILDTGGDLTNEDLCYHRSVNFDPWSSTPSDGHGHGTHVAGTAAARDDNGTVVGMAPTARLWAVKVCSDFGTCDGAAIISGIDWVTARADTIDVVNMSLGGGGSDSPHAENDCEAITGNAQHLAICKSVRAGVTYVVAAGNSSADASTFVPAAYDEVVTVSASDSLQRPASFTNYGADVDVIAPGVSILSNAIGGGTTRMSGTSMASPHVAGGAALYIAGEMNAGRARPTPFAVRDILVGRSQPWTNQGGRHPEGLLDVRTF